MEKALLISLDVVIDLDENNIKKFFKMIKKLKKNNNTIFFMSRDSKKLEHFKNQFEEHFVSYFDDDFNSYADSYIFFYTRTEIKSLIEDVNENKFFVVIGNKDVDFYLAVNNKLLFLFPNWTKKFEDKAMKYGIPIPDVETLKNFIFTCNNQNAWFFELKLPDNSIVLSLMDASYRRYSKSASEREMVEHFEKVLKKGKIKNYYDILLYHFLSSISNNCFDIFDEIDYWCIFPSSSTNLNPEMLEFKKHIRYMMNSKEKYSGEENNLLIRHTNKYKSHDRDYQYRIEHGAIPNLQTIQINPEFKNKIAGKNICVLDDYLTHGNSFEAARNLLKKAGANKMVFVSLGKFKSPSYIYQEITLEGDVFSKNFSILGENKRILIQESQQKFNPDSKIEISNLHKIFNG